jgi:hypothetical protein
MYISSGNKSITLLLVSHMNKFIHIEQTYMGMHSTIRTASFLEIYYDIPAYSNQLKNAVRKFLMAADLGTCLETPAGFIFCVREDQKVRS